MQKLPVNTHREKELQHSNHSSFIRTMTVGFGISPNQPEFACRLVGCTTGGELRPALKNFFILGIDVSIPHIVYDEPGEFVNKILKIAVYFPKTKSYYT